MKKSLKIFGLALVLVVGLIMVGCGDKDDSNTGAGVVYGVIFETGVEGMEIPTLAVEPNKKAVPPEVPLRAGFEFVGWQYGDRLWDFDVDLVTENIILTAVWEIDSVSWEYTDGLSFRAVSNGYEVAGYVGEDSEVVLPLYFDGSSGPKPVVKIGADAFKDSSVTRVILTENVTEIGERAFMNAEISSFCVSGVINYIGESAFEGSALQSVEFEASAERLEIGARAFSETALTRVVVPDRLVKIGDEAFMGSEINVLAFGAESKLTQIGARAFSGVKITTLKLPESLKTVGAEAFKNCSSLAYAILPSGLKYAGEKVFIGNSRMSAIYYSGNVFPDKSGFNENWRGSNLLEYRYSAVMPNSAGYWKFSNLGIPELYTNYANVKVDLNSALSLDKSKLSQYYAGVRLYYYTRENVFSVKYVELGQIGEDGELTIEVDLFNHIQFNLEVYHEGVSEYSSREDILVEWTGILIDGLEYELS